MRPRAYAKAPRIAFQDGLFAFMRSPERTAAPCVTLRRTRRRYSVRARTSRSLRPRDPLFVRTGVRLLTRGFDRPHPTGSDVTDGRVRPMPPRTDTHAATDPKGLRPPRQWRVAVPPTASSQRTPSISAANAGAGRACRAGRHRRRGAMNFILTHCVGIDNILWQL